MEKQTPEIVNLEHDGNQEKGLAQISSPTAATAPIAAGIARQPVEPPEPGPGPADPPVLDISISSPANNASVSGLASQGGVTITASGGIIADHYTVQSVAARFGTSTVNLAASKGNWTCTSNKITASEPLTIFATVTGKNSETNKVDTRTAKVNVTVVITDDVPPAVTINQPTQVTEEPNGKYTALLKGTVTDNMSGIKKLDYIVDGDGTNARTIPTVFLPAWEVNVPLDFSFSPHTITVRATDGANRTSTVNQTIATVDKTAPMLLITEPEQDQITLPGTNQDGARLARLSGTAKDTQSGMQKIEWALDPRPESAYTQAVLLPKPTTNDLSWSVQDIPIPAGTLHTIKVRCDDGVGNRTEKDVLVSVSEQYPPKDPTVQEYFSSLIDFLVRRVKVLDQDRPLRVADLTAEFYQPFQSLLSADTTLSTQLVHQIRICIEVLRQYLTKHGPLSAVAQQGLKQAEANYRQAAYEILLKRIGTSFEEIRAARLADEPTRQALAQRLGFDLKPPAPEPDPLPTSLRSSARVPVAPEPTPEPDPLQQLLLQPGQFTEADLDTLFGLVDTTRDPLQPRSVNPKLLDWQLQFLKAGWASQDDAAAVPVIDPDVIGEADVQPGSVAYALWQSRYNWVNNELLALRKLRESVGNDLVAGFDTVIKGILGPSADLLALDAQRLAGADIEPQLAEKQLTLAAFVHLMGLRKLAAAGTILASEWDDVYSILVQVEKLRSFASWRVEERASKVVLGPDAFRLPYAGQTSVPPAVSPEWRMTVQARQIWQDILKARIDQQEALKQALLSVVDATEEDTLPLLRDALVTAIGAPEPLSEVADSMTQMWLIDITTSGYQKITRVAQAIQTLQAILMALRTGRLAVAWEQDIFKESQENFDEELEWIGSYGAWYSAMQVFLFPENFLLPTLRPVPDLPPNEHTPSVMEKAEQTHAFRELIKKLRDPSELTPEQARTFAQEYLQTLKQDYESKHFQFPQHLFDSVLPPPKPFQITEQYTRSELLKLFDRTRIVIPANTNPQDIPAHLREIFYFVPIALALHLQKSGQYLAALDWFRVVYAYDLPVNQRKIYYGLELEHESMPDPSVTYERNVFWLNESLNPHDKVSDSYKRPESARYDAYTRFMVMSLARCFLEFADAEFTQDTNESLPRARSLYMQALDLLTIPEMNPPAVPGLSPNSVVASLKFHAQVNLAKLRSGRNIAGLKRQLELVAQSGLAPATQACHPTPYRYAVLIERAKQLVTIAQQVEAAYLSALEKHDNEAYNLLKATQDLGLAQANVQLQDLRVSEAANSLILAGRQQERAQIQIDTYGGFLRAGMNEWERKLLVDYREVEGARTFLAGVDGALTVAQTLASVSSGGFLGTGLGAGIGGTIIVGALAGHKAIGTTVLNHLEADVQEHNLRASFEQRQQEWSLQLDLAYKDGAISAQQVLLAKDHQSIVGQEQSIAQMQHTNAQATVGFLARKFTNAELYEWMSGVLRQVYSYFLQQATALAQLAQHQLAFERQEVPPGLIRNDYWQPPTDGSGTASDRRGLTGSARLLQDIYQLDQFAFETNKRKLQLTKTISLARLAPLEFQRFRESGVLTFATPMKLFDSDFPGHYLRLIKRVRTSVVALIPPNQGIRATLTTAGVSRVVVGGDVFQTITVRRDPESIALTSPMNATGLFELEPPSELLLPFEFMGVDTRWHLEMPKAANPFDYRTIADVLITIEYTALSSLDYRQQVIQQLDRKFSADRPYSFRHQFADQWYDLNNPEQTATPMVVSFSTAREDFPPNVENLTMQQVALYFALADGTTIENFLAQLHFTEQGSQTPLGGEAAATPEGIISTRLGNAAGWTPMIGRSPFGQWELALPNTAAVRNLFESEAIEDIVFVITSSGRTPAWPL